MKLICYFFYFIENQVKLSSIMRQYPNNILEYPHLRNGIFDKLISQISFFSPISSLHQMHPKFRSRP